MPHVEAISDKLPWVKEIIKDYVLNKFVESSF